MAAAAGAGTGAVAVGGGVAGVRSIVVVVAAAVSCVITAFFVCVEQGLSGRDGGCWVPVYGKGSSFKT